MSSPDDVLPWCVALSHIADAVVPLVKEQTVCGRHPQCDLVLPCMSASRFHFKIHRRRAGCYVEDLASRCGTSLSQGIGINNGYLRPDCETRPGAWIVIGRMPLRVGDVFGHPDCYLTLQLAAPMELNDWFARLNSQGVLWAIRGTPAATQHRLHAFLDACTELLDREAGDDAVLRRLKEHPDAWSAAAGLARFVVAATTDRLVRRWRGVTEDTLQPHADSEIWQACELAEFQVCRLLWEVIVDPPAIRPCRKSL